MANNITYVKQKSGVIYAYENLGTWDKVNKKPICRRRLIGKVDPVTKEIVPTDQRNKSQSPDYVQPPYEKGYEMPTTLAGRKNEILRLLKENYELKQKIEELEKKIAEATAKTEAAETVEKTKLLKQQTVHQLNNFFFHFLSGSCNAVCLFKAQSYRFKN